MSVLNAIAALTPGIDAKLKILHAVDKPLEEISVKEICEKAGISRDTFYRHFSSKYDIAIWHGKLVQTAYIDEAGRTLDLLTGYRHHFRVLAEEYVFYRSAFKNLGRANNEFPEMNDHRKQTLIETLRDYRHVDIDDDMLFCIDAFVQLETMLITRWLSDGCSLDSDTFASRMVSMIPNRLYDAWEL